MSSSRFKKLFVLGFSLSFIFIVVLALLWVRDTQRNNLVLEGFIAEYENLHLVTSMRQAAHRRTLNLYQMTNTMDPFIRDQLYMEILELGEEFILARNQFFSKGLNPQEKATWKRASKHLTRAGELHHQAAELIAENRSREARQLIVNEIVREQQGFMLSMDNLLDLSRESVSHRLNTVKERNQATYITVFILTAFSVILGLINLVFYHRSKHSETLLMKQGERIRALYEVSTRSDLSFDEQITETLRVGCKLLNMEIGKVGRLDVEKNESLFLNTVCPADLPIKRGMVMPLDKTYCNITFHSSKPLAINHVGKSMYSTEPCYKFLGIEAYIGTTISVNGSVFGTVHFSNRKPREPFTETDLDLINLMGSWVAVTMERQFAQEELEKSKESAEKANRFKSQFLANMSHEIRTPLTAIIGYSEFLRDDNTMDKENRRNTIDTIIRSGQHLHQIINNILDLSKIEAGELNLESLPVSPFHIIVDIQNQLKKSIVEKGLLFNTHFHFPLPKVFESDPTRIKQILLNLCNNAIKFTEQGGIDIDVFYQDNNNGHFLVIDVTDTGIGMSEEEQKKVMNPFAQADSSTTRKYGGTGLGLSISKQLTEKLGGSLSLFSEKGKGSRFTVKIDLKTPPAELVHEFNNERQSIAAHQGELSIPHAHILLAEDNVDNQNLIALFLKNANVTLDIAENGEQAIDMAANKQYDLILMDIQMPLMDGKDAIKILRDNGYKGPIVTVTANTLKEDLDLYRKLGADDNIGKPIGLKEFYDTISKYLSHLAETKAS